MREASAEAGPQRARVRAAGAAARVRVHEQSWQAGVRRESLFEQGGCKASPLQDTPPECPLHTIPDYTHPPRLHRHRRRLAPGAFLRKHGESMAALQASCAELFVPTASPTWTKEARRRRH